MTRNGWIRAIHSTDGQTKKTRIGKRRGRLLGRKENDLYLFRDERLQGETTKERTRSCFKRREQQKRNGASVGESMTVVSSSLSEFPRIASICEEKDFHRTR